MNGTRVKSTSTRGKQEPSMREMTSFFSERIRFMIHGESELVSSSTGLGAGFSHGRLVRERRAKSLGNLVECRVDESLFVKRKPPHHLPSLSHEHQDISTTTGGESGRREKAPQKAQKGPKNKKIKKKKTPEASHLLRRTSSYHEDDTKDRESMSGRKFTQVHKALSSPATVPVNTPEPLEQDDSAHPLRSKQRGLNLRSFCRRLTQRCRVEPNQLEKVPRPYGRRVTATLVQEEILPLESGQVSVRRNGVCIGSDDFLRERTRTRVVFKRLGSEEELTLPKINVSE